MKKQEQPSRAELRRAAVAYFEGRTRPFTPAEMKDFFGKISDDTLLRWRKDGLRSFQKGNVHLYHVEDVYRFLVSHTH